MKSIFTLLLILLSIFCLAQQAETSKEFQDNLNKDYANTSKSPLAAEDLKVFRGLDFYDISVKFIVEATFKKLENQPVFEMKTTTLRLPKYKKYGEITFEIDRVLYKLNVYQNLDLIKTLEYADYLFLPFLDLTCENQSYIGGRYIDLKIPSSNKIIVDFNKAYNPYCAYSSRFSCPIVPFENSLNLQILAGVKKFH